MASARVSATALAPALHCLSTLPLRAGKQKLGVRWNTVRCLAHAFYLRLSVAA
jgi:hypothetical protein